MVAADILFLGPCFSWLLFVSFNLLSTTSLESSQLVFRVKIVYSFEVLRTFDLERSDVQITHTHTHTHKQIDIHILVVLLLLMLRSCEWLPRRSEVGCNQEQFLAICLLFLWSINFNRSLFLQLNGNNASAHAPCAHSNIWAGEIVPPQLTETKIIINI